MMAVQVRIENLDQLRANFRRAPATTLKYLAAATKASAFEVEKQAVDENFQFKTPRGRRTGYLAQSFSFGRNFANGGLRGTVGPTARYAIYVHQGTSRGISPNPYMERIAAAASPAITGHFNTATERIVADIAKV